MSNDAVMGFCHNAAVIVILPRRYLRFTSIWGRPKCQIMLRLWVTELLSKQNVTASARRRLSALITRFLDAV